MPHRIRSGPINRQARNGISYSKPETYEENRSITLNNNDYVLTAERQANLKVELKLENEERRIKNRLRAEHRKSRKLALENNPNLEATIKNEIVQMLGAGQTLYIGKAPVGTTTLHDSVTGIIVEKFELPEAIASAMAGSLISRLIAEGILDSKSVTYGPNNKRRAVIATLGS